MIATSTRAGQQGLGLQVGAHASAAHLAPQPRELEAAEGRAWLMGQGVDQHAARIDLARHALAAFRVRAQHQGAQAIARVVGNGDRIGFVLVGDDGQHGAEDFLAYNAHLVVGPGEERGLDEPSCVQAIGAAFSACQQRGAFFLPDADVALYPLPLLAAHHRADVGVGIARVARPDVRDRLLRHLLELCQAAARHEDARARDAGLAAVHEPGHQHERHDGGEVRIVEHHGWRLAAQLQRHALHRGRARGHQMRAHGGRPRERDIGDARVARNLLTDNIAAPIG